MPLIRRKPLLILAALVLLAIGLAAAFIGSGLYSVAADEPHTRPIYALLQTVRDRSIAARASRLEAPDLSDPELIRQGAGNYDSMCTGCHLAPGMSGTELSKGLYPNPPALANDDAQDPRKAFWVIKHGIKATGMPAWGKSMEDPYIWGMVAFIQQLPKLDVQGYRELVESSEGHSHGGGETLGKDTDGDGASHHDSLDAPSASADQPPSAPEHAHEHDQAHEH